MVSLEVDAPNVLEWLNANSDALQDCNPRRTDSLDERIDRSLEFFARLDAAGLTGWGWPTESGGRGGSTEHRAELYDAITAAGFGMPEQVGALEVLGSALVAHNPGLASRYLPELLAGRALWCQGFSEPEAGSDLASLRTKAVPDGDGWKITGQKVWTSLGHRSDWCGVLARTGAPDSRHRGLTLFWVDLKAPGVEVRPLLTLTGEEEFSEVFLDGVHVPADHVVGPVDGGWGVAMDLLQYERGMWAWQRQAIMHSTLSGLVADLDGADVLAASAVAEAYTSLAALRMRCRETVKRLAAGERLGPEVSIDKILLGQTEHLVHDAVRAVHVRDFAVGDSAEADTERAEWFYSRAATVYGGAAEVQKNIVAERVLGLPREAARG